MKRAAAVAGQFYPENAGRLADQISGLLRSSGPREEAIGIMVPHAGLVYSGGVAGEVYASIVPPATFLMLGPNHTGLGDRVSVMDDGEWQIPTASISIDRKLARGLLRHAPLARSDSRAHLFEHSLEVQLPFLAAVAKDAKIVPVALMSLSFDECMAVAEGVSKAVAEAGYAVVILASSDMSHFLPDRTAREKDRKALDRILAMDPAGLYEVVTSERISMCGYLPATVMLMAARMRGARRARLVKYATSGDVSGDYESVVGYAGVLVTAG